MTTKRSMWLLVAAALGFILVGPWGPAAQEQEQPKKAVEQAPQATAPESPVPQISQEPQKAQEPTQPPTTPEAPAAPAALEQEQPKKAVEQAPQATAPDSPVPQISQDPQKAQEPTQPPTTPEAAAAPAPPPALELPPGVACNNTPAAASNSGTPKKLNPCMGIPEATAEGRTMWMQTGCNGCHGMGGGGMGPSVMDDLWKFGSDDETLFKIIKGTYPGQTMPNVFGMLLKDEQVWKILAWVRSIYKGDPTLIVW